MHTTKCSAFAFLALALALLGHGLPLQPNADLAYPAGPVLQTRSELCGFKLKSRHTDLTCSGGPVTDGEQADANKAE